MVVKERLDQTETQKHGQKRTTEVNYDRTGASGEKDVGWSALAAKRQVKEAFLGPCLPRLPNSGRPTRDARVRCNTAGLTINLSVYAVLEADRPGPNVLGSSITVYPVLGT